MAESERICRPLRLGSRRTPILCDLSIVRLPCSGGAEQPIMLALLATTQPPRRTCAGNGRSWSAPRRVLRPAPPGRPGWRCGVELVGIVGGALMDRSLGAQVKDE